LLFSLLKAEVNPGFKKRNMHAHIYSFLASFGGVGCGKGVGVSLSPSNFALNSLN
jgi:hypothetical protein